MGTMARVRVLGQAEGMPESRIAEDGDSREGAAQVRDRLLALPGGNVVIAVLGRLFKCSPAPYEMAILLHEHLSRRGVRDASTIHIVTPMPRPIPISGETSAALIGLLYPAPGSSPKARASTVADVLIARITGGTPPDPYSGEMTCYVEMGDNTVGTINANFLSGAAPTALFTPPSLEAAGDNAAPPLLVNIAGSDLGRR